MVITIAKRKYFVAKKVGIIWLHKLHLHPKMNVMVNASGTSPHFGTNSFLLHQFMYNAFFFFFQMGDHEELLLKDGLYAKLNKIQADILT